MISIKLLIIQALPAIWTILFSLSNTPRLRGIRNLGIIGCYITLIVLIITNSFIGAITSWLILGVSSGIIYFLYEFICSLKSKQDEQFSIVKIKMIFDGLFLWPIMLPEAIEYILADLGLLKQDKTN